MSDILDNAWELAKYVLILIVVIIIIAYFVNWWNQNHQVIVDSIAKTCGIEQTVLDSLNTTLVQEIKDDRSRAIAQNIMNGQKISDCDWSTFLKYLDADERKKLKIYDVVCDFSSCVK